MARGLKSDRRPGAAVKDKAGLGAGLTSRGRAVMRAFREVRRQAPGFVVSCGVLPEVSELASDRLHRIVHDAAERHLDGRRARRALQRALRDLTGTPEAADRLERHVTALLGSEATAAYLFGLSVGLSIHALPERLTRHGR